MEKKKEEMEERRRSRGIRSYNPYLWFGSKENMLSGGDGTWFHNTVTEEEIRADAPPTAWMQYQDEDQRAWWFNQTSGEWFYPDSLPNGEGGA